MLRRLFSAPATLWTLALWTSAVCAAEGAAPSPPAALPDRWAADLARVRATPDPADDLALARRLIEQAKAAATPTAAAPLLRTAYDLAVGEGEAGFRLAVEAMETLARRAGLPEAVAPASSGAPAVPATGAAAPPPAAPAEAGPSEEGPAGPASDTALLALADEVRDKTLEAYQRRYNAARGPERVRAGVELARRIVAYADRLLADRRFGEAARLYRRAMPLATNLRDVPRDRIKAKLDFAATREAFGAQVERLADHLKAHPDDAKARRKLLVILVAEFDDPQAAARRLDLAEDDPLNRYILLAGMRLERLPLAACAALGRWYRGLAEEASPQGRLLAMRRARRYYQRYLKEAPADAPDRAEVEQDLAEVNEALGRAAAALPLVTVLPAETFRKAWADRFPPSANAVRSAEAGGAVATASSHWGDRLPARALEGERTGTAWSLAGPRGWFQVRWSPPVFGRYVLLFARDGAPGENAWGRATLALNDAPPRRLDGVASGKVVVVDLGMNVPLKSLRLTIQGTMYPGLAGVEVHPGPEPEGLFPF